MYFIFVDTDGSCFMYDGDLFNGKTPFYTIHPPNWFVWWWFLHRLQAAKQKAGKKPVTRNLVLRRFLGDLEGDERELGWDVWEQDRADVRSFLRERLDEKGLELQDVQLEKIAHFNPYELFCARVTV